MYSLQVVEAMMCMFRDAITYKRVSVGSLGAYTKVPGDTQCRACSSAQPWERVNHLERGLLKHQCIAGGADCRYSVPEIYLTVCTCICGRCNVRAGWSRLNAVCLSRVGSSNRFRICILEHCTTCVMTTFQPNN